MSSRDADRPRSSAGIRHAILIVCGVLTASAAHPGPAAAQVAGWRVGRLDTATASFGAEGPEPLFHVAGGLLLGDTIVVADRGAGTLHFYLRSGELLRVAGGKGKGPGQFESFRWIQELDGQVLAYDRDLRRLSRFSRSGDFQRSTQIASARDFSFPEAVGVFSDGSILVTAGRAESAFQRRVGTYRPLLALLRYGEDGTYLDSLGASAPVAGLRLRLTEVFDRMPKPSTFPVYGWDGNHHLTVLRVDRTGGVWVLHYGGVRSSEPRWTVFRKDGTAIAEFSAPDEVDILDATDGEVLVRRWDPQDVEMVQIRPRSRYGRRRA